MFDTNEEALDAYTYVDNFLVIMFNNKLIVSIVYFNLNNVVVCTYLDTFNRKQEKFSESQ